MKKISYLIVAIAALSCTNSTKNLPDEFDFGKAKNGLYTNAFFEMEVSFNPNWVLQDEQQVNNLIEAGGDIVGGKNEQLKAAVEASKVNTAYLLTIFKNEVGSAVNFNPSFMIIAENTKNFPGIKTGEDYLFHTKKLLEQTQMAYYFDKDVFEKTIGNAQFYVMEAKLDYLSNTITQEYITTVKNGFSLSCVASYSNDDERDELYKIIENIKI